MFERIKNTLATFCLAEKLFLLCAMGCSFLISFDYAIIRPVSSSLFIADFSAKALPYVWIGSVPINFLIVFLYNRYVSKVSFFRLFFIVAIIIALGNVASGFFLPRVQHLSFLFYAWKDIYVMLMFQLLWSVIHATINTAKAQYLYGLLFAIGALGGLFGSMLAGACATKWGSENLLFTTFATYAVLSVFYYMLIKCRSNHVNTSQKQDFPRLRITESYRLITSSKLLMGILLMVVFMQVSSTLTDFQFNTYVERLFPEKDDRTAYLGKLLSYGNLITMSLQLIGVYFLIRTIGKYRAHMLVPSTLCLLSVLFGVCPSFAFISLSFLTIKAFDFSLFNVIKEMLYIPLRAEEKFQAKAIIDVFIYRGAKVFASLFVLALQPLFAAHIISMIACVNTALFVLWIYLIYSIREYYLLEKLPTNTLQEE